MSLPCGHPGWRGECRADRVPEMEYCAQHGLALCTYWLAKDALETRPQYVSTAEELSAMVVEGNKYLEALKEVCAGQSFTDAETAWKQAVEVAQPVIARLQMESAVAA